MMNFFIKFLSYVASFIFIIALVSVLNFVQNNKKNLAGFFSENGSISKERYFNKIKENDFKRNTIKEDSAFIKLTKPKRETRWDNELLGKWKDKESFNTFVYLCEKYGFILDEFKDYKDCELLLLEYGKTDMQLHNWLNFAINDNKFLENLNQTKQNINKEDLADLEADLSNINKKLNKNEKMKNFVAICRLTGICPRD